MEITACVVSWEVVSKMTKSSPIIHAHVEENSVSKSVACYMPIQGQEAHRLFLSGTPSMVYSLLYGVSL